MIKKVKESKLFGEEVKQIKSQVDADNTLTSAQKEEKMVEAIKEMKNKTHTPKIDK